MQQASLNPIPLRWRSEVCWMILLFILSLLLRLVYVIPSGFDGLYGQDAYAYYDFAQVMREALTTGKPLEAFFWPLGYPALLAAGFSLFGVTASVGQVINVLLGSALSPLVYMLARQCAISRVSATLSAVVMLVCGQAVQSSIVLMSDIPALFWATLSAVMLLKYAKSEDAGEVMPRPYTLTMSIVLLALASITRWLYLVLFVPWGIALLMRWKWRIQWRNLLIAASAASVIFLPQLIYSNTNPAPALNHAFVNGWSLANALLKDFTTVEGHFTFQHMNALYYAQPFYDAYYLSPVFTPLLIIGLWQVRGRGIRINHRDTEITQRAVILVAWIILPYVFLIGIPGQNIRFPLIVFPAVAVLVGYGFEWIMIRNWNRRGAGNAEIRRSVVIFRVGVWIAVCSIGFGGIVQTLSAAGSTINQFITTQQRDKTTAAWVKENVPDDATLYTFGLTLTLKHYTTLDVYELYYETPQTLAAKWQRGREDYLLINVWNIENQWQGHEPQTDYHWLRDERGLTEMGKMGYYTLFRVGG